MANDRVSDRVRHYQAGASVAELLAYGLARREEDVDGLYADVVELLRRFPSVNSLRNLSAADLVPLGFTEQEAHHRLALIRLGQKIAVQGSGETVSADHPEAIAQRYAWLRDERREFFILLLLNTKMHVVMERTISIGTLNSSLVSAREVFREAVREGAYGVICLHNHPSGDPQPSPEDIQVTQTLKRAGELLDIELIDHIIVGDPDHFSFRRNRLL